MIYFIYLYKCCISNRKLYARSVAQSGRALGLGPRGRRFKSYHSDHLIMNKAKIYQPTKTAMQSGLGKIENWILEFETENTGINPLMGWESSIDTLSEVKLKFSIPCIDSYSHLNLKPKRNY